MGADATGAAEFMPDRRSLTALRKAAASCRGCELHEDTTQTIFGAGRAKARMLLVGEQPGDQEDRQGAPFVGPAGGVLDRVLEDVGLNRSELYLTNVVKHFRFVRPERGKRRLHKTPAQSHIVACRPWWVAEFVAVKPELVVCLGAVAAKAVLGRSFRVTDERGRLLDLPEPIDGLPEPTKVLATIHPSAVLRAADRKAMYSGLRADLAVAAEALGGPSATPRS
jgi:DNA polymerase